MQKILKAWVIMCYFFTRFKEDETERKSIVGELFPAKFNSSCWVEIFLEYY